MDRVAWILSLSMGGYASCPGGAVVSKLHHSGVGEMLGVPAERGAENAAFPDGLNCRVGRYGVAGGKGPRAIGFCFEGLHWF